MKLSFKIAVLALALTSNLAPLLAAPAVKLLANDFPDVSPVLLQLVVTFASFFVIPALLSVDFISMRFSKKSILIVGLVLYIIGGIGPAFMNSVGSILVFRAILGISIGLISPMMSALIAENSQGAERTKLNGYMMTVGGLGGAIFLSIGGVIASFGWRGVFFTYSYAVVLILLVALFIPKTTPQRAATKVSHTKATKLPLKVYAIGLATSGVLLLYYAIPTNLAMYINDNHMGNAATVGYVTSASLIAIFLGGTFVSRLINLLKGSIIPFAMILLTLSFLTLSTAQALWLVFPAVMFTGFVFGMLYPIFMNRIVEAAPKERLTFAVTLLFVFTYLGQFISPIVLNGIHQIGFSSIRSTFAFIAAANGFGLIISLIFRMKKRNPRPNTI